MGTVYSTTILEAFVCDAKGMDALLPRHGKAGPARQGQAFHAFAEAYLGHLFARGIGSDTTKAKEIWSGIASALSPNDESQIESCVSHWYDDDFSWLNKSDAVEIEKRSWLTLDGAECKSSIHGSSPAPLFAYQPDLVWWGDGPSNTSDGLDSSAANLLDWKTSWSIDHVHDAHNNRQLLRYAAARFPGDEPVRVWIGFPRHGYYESAVIDGPTRKRAWHDLVVVPIQRIESRRAGGDSFEYRTVGSHCRFCDLRRGCDAAIRYPQDILAAGKDITNEEALAGLLISRELVNDYQAIIKARLGESGPMESGNIHAEVEETSTFESVDIKRTREMLVGVLPPDMIDECFLPTKGSLRRVLTRARLPRGAREQLIDEICHLGIEKKRSRLKVRMSERPPPPPDVPS